MSSSSSLSSSSHVIDLTNEDEEKLEEDYSCRGGGGKRPRLNTIKELEKEKLIPHCPQPFYLLKSDYPSSTNNENCISMQDVLSSEDNNPIECVVLFNYMVDISWLIDTIPLLATIPCYCYHGSSQADFAEAHRMLPLFTAAKVHVSVAYGTHHSKMGLIFYKNGLRLFIATNNLIPVDNTFKTQGIYVRDFPLRTSEEVQRNVLKKDLEFDFEYNLKSYLEEVRVAIECSSFERASVKLSEICTTLLPRYDFSSANVLLVASVPGHHAKDQLWKYGHMRMRRIFGRFPSPAGFEDTHSSLVMQVSSLGSMGKEGKALAEIISSFTTAAASSSSSSSSFSFFASSSSPAVKVELVWPTVESVRSSDQGYPAGRSICCNTDVMFYTSLWSFFTFHCFCIADSLHEGKESQV